MKRKFIKGILLASAAIVLGGCGKKNANTDTVSDANLETTTVVQTETESMSEVSGGETVTDGTTAESTSAAVGYSEVSGHSEYMAVDNDEDLITFNYKFGFVNKAGKVLNVSPVIASTYDYRFNMKMYNLDEEAEYGTAAIYVTEGSSGYELYYVDKNLDPVMLTDNVYPGNWVYYETSFADISRDGSKVMYCTADGNMDLYLYDNTAGTNTLIDSDVLRAYFTIDSNYIVYLKPNDGTKAEVDSSVVYINREGETSDYIIYDVRNHSELRRIKTSQYFGDDFSGYIDVNDNGDVLIFNGLNGTSYFGDGSIYLLRQDEAISVFNPGSSYSILTDRDADEMFIVSGGTIYYFDVNAVKLVELSDFDISVPIDYTSYKFSMNVDTLDKTVLVGSDGVYLWNKNTYTCEKLADMEGYGIVVRVLENGNSILCIDDNGIYRIDDYATQPTMTTLLEADTDTIESFGYVAADAPLYVEFSGDQSTYAINQDGTGEHKLGENDVFYGSKYSYTYMKYAGKYLYDDGTALYDIDRNFTSKEKICDIGNIAVINGDFGEFVRSVWCIYTTLDGSTYMYNGTDNIKLD